MPAFLTGSDRRLLALTVGVAVVLVVAAAVLTESPVDTAQAPTTYSAGSSGAKAAYLVLERLGYRVRRWQRPLDQLEPTGAATIVLVEPEIGATNDERDALREFAEDGGRVLAIGRNAGGFLWKDQIVGGVPLVEPKTVRALTPSRFSRAAPEITIAPRAVWLRSDTNVIPLYGDAESALIITAPHGDGELIWWASASPLTNLGLKNAGSLELLLESVGGPDREIIWDEYVHGHRDDAATDADRSAMWLAGQAAFAALALLFTFSRRSGPVVEPAGEHRLSPLEFVRTLGALYERAGAASVAVRVANRRLLLQLAGRLGLPATAAPARFADAAAMRWGIDRESVKALLERAATEGDRVDLRARDALPLIQEMGRVSERLGLGDASGAPSPREGTV